MERLDEFSKLLAASVSRRESLRTIGAVLAGAVLSPLVVGTAWAARPDRCTAFCRSCPTKKKRNQCVAACQACNGNTTASVEAVEPTFVALRGRPVATGHAPP